MDPNRTPENTNWSGIIEHQEQTATGSIEYNETKLAEQNVVYCMGIILDSVSKKYRIGDRISQDIVQESFGREVIIYARTLRFVAIKLYI